MNPMEQIIRVEMVFRRRDQFLGFFLSVWDVQSVVGLRVVIEASVLSGSWWGLITRGIHWGEGGRFQCRVNASWRRLEKGSILRDLYLNPSQMWRRGPFGGRVEWPKSRPISIGRRLVSLRGPPYRDLVGIDRH